ncbi:hypothetical protein H5410_005973, partial [Solanum commersonii]
MRTPIVEFLLEDLKSAIEEVSTHQKDLQSAIEEVSTHQKDLKSAIEEIYTHLKESNPPLKMSTPTEEKGEVSTDLKLTVEEVSSEKGEVSTDLKSTAEKVSSEKGEVSTDLKFTVEEVSSEKGEVSTDPKSTVEEVSSEKGEVSTNLTSTIEEVSTHLKESNPPLKMSTPTEKVSREKGEASTDLKSNPPLKMSTPIDEVSREKGQVSTNLKSTIEEVSAQLKEFNYEDWISKLTNLIVLVYNFADQHFPSSKQQKISDIEHQIRLYIKVLKSVPQEKRESNRECTVFEYLKGRFYNAILDVYKEEAESHLQKSIEINLHLRKAWNCLTSCFTKKGDFDRVEKCYQIAFKMGKENTIILRELAALELKLSRDAASMNPDSGALHQTELMLQLLGKIEGLLRFKRNEKNKGKSKRKSKRKSKGKSTETSLPDRIQSVANIDGNRVLFGSESSIQQSNKWMAVIAAVQCLVKYEYKAPVYYMLCDSDENSFVLAVFGIQKEAIKQGDQVTLLDPICKFVDFEWEGKHYQFKSVRVNLLEQVLVNGNALSANFAMHESLQLGITE